MKNKLSFSESLLVGSLLFGLFFGAGNLIFPVMMGQMAGENGLVATIGFLITGVGLPLLGIVASAVSNSSSMYEMAMPVGKRYAMFFTCLLYLTIGPFFAIPRTATVAFEVGFRPFFSADMNKIGLLIFSIIFFSLTLYFSLRPGKIMDYVGKFLTPTFILLLSIIILFAIIKPMGNPSDFPSQGNYAIKPFSTGLLDGYNTMDALAALAFAIIIISNIKALGVTKEKYIAIETLKGGIFCVIGMSLIYASLSYIGASSLGSISRGENGGQILSMVSEHYLGLMGKILLAGVVTVACLKTAIGLITACSQMFVELFEKRISYNKFAIGFVLFSLSVANIGLSKIISLSIPVLMFSYPLAISLIILSFATPFFGKDESIYKCTTYFALGAAVFDFLNALPVEMREIGIIAKFIDIGKILPGFEYGFGWILPTIVGFILGIILRSRRRKYI